MLCWGAEFNRVQTFSVPAPSSNYSAFNMERAAVPQGAPGRGPHSSRLGPQQSRWRGWRAWRCRLTTGALCKLLAGMVASLVVFHAASCGFFFCYRIPGEGPCVCSETLNASALAASAALRRTCQP